MILKKIVLKNFRQFYDEQTISFGNSENNVTVIFGENGRGKTGLYRAAIFCLFGERTLSQDGDLKNNEIHLVNNYALNKYKGEGVPAFVQLDFIHQEIEYSLKRSMLGLLEDNEVSEEIVEVELQYIDSSGNSKTTKDPEFISEKINNILDPRVKEYFLFDGEKIERLTRADNRQKKEIAKGIRNLLDVDILEKVMKSFEKAKSISRQHLKSKSTGEMQSVLKNIEESEDKQKQLVEQNNKIKEEIDNANDELIDIDEKLLEFNEIKELVEERKRLASKDSELDTQLNDKKTEMKAKIAKSASLLIHNEISNVYKKLNLKVESGEIPSAIKRQLIEIIIKNKECICKRPIETGTKEYNEILEWLKKTESFESDELALKTWRDLNSVIDSAETVKDDMHRMLLEYGKIINSKTSITDRIDEIHEEIKDCRSDGDSLEKQRERIEKDLLEMQKKLGVNESDLNLITEELTKLNSKKDLLEKDESIKTELHKQFNLIENANKALEVVYKSFSDDIKKLIGENASNFFEQLIDSAGHKNLKNVIVNDDYSLQVFDKYGDAFLADISAGQRQVMSIAFILSLAKVASGERLFEMPLFMDTPFGRLSYEHRENLINILPENCSQWILLATDTEFRKQEASALLKTKKFKTFYRLSSDNDGNTSIKQIDVDNILTYLG